MPFLEVPGLAHKILIGRIWLAEQDVDISARHRYLKWPTKRQRSPPAYDLKMVYPEKQRIKPGY